MCANAAPAQPWQPTRLRFPRAVLEKHFDWLYAPPSRSNGLPESTQSDATSGTVESGTNANALCRVEAYYQGHRPDSRDLSAPRSRPCAGSSGCTSRRPEVRRTRQVAVRGPQPVLLAAGLRKL